MLTVQIIARKHRTEFSRKQTFEFKLWQFDIIGQINRWRVPFEVDIFHIIGKRLDIDAAHLYEIKVNKKMRHLSFSCRFG